MTWKRAVLVVIGVLALAVGLSALAHRVAAERQQDALDPFYATPADVAALRPGALIRSEPLPGAALAGARSLRILYRTERPDGSPAVSGAMVFVPDAPAPADGRPVLAYAHGTLGQGRGCAPSRRADPLGVNAAWLQQAVDAGFAVVATDYAGLGTAGPNLYLVGEAEARDVANSVRALEDVPDASIGDRWVVFGHSQGGHSALWTADLVREVLPERQLIGVAAAAPAADLPAIVAKQWDTGIGWGVGAEVANSWPAAFPGLGLEATISGLGRTWQGPVADACLAEGVPVPVMLGFIAGELGLPFFARDPLDEPRIAKVAAAQSARPLPDTLPVLIAQGTADTVVPPSSTAALQEAWCRSGVDLSMLWMGGVGHVNAATTAAPTVVPWLRSLFEGNHPEPQCSGPPPVAVSRAQVLDLLELTH